MEEFERQKNEAKSYNGRGWIIVVTFALPTKAKKRICNKNSKTGNIICEGTEMIMLSELHCRFSNTTGELLNFIVTNFIVIPITGRESRQKENPFANWDVVLLGIGHPEVLERIGIFSKLHLYQK